MPKKPLSLRLLFATEMHKREMSQAELARVIGVSRQYLSGYFAGRYNIGHDAIEKLLDYFDLIKQDNN